MEPTTPATDPKDNLTKVLWIGREPTARGAIPIRWTPQRESYLNRLLAKWVAEG